MYGNRRPNYRPYFNDEMDPHRVFMDLQNDEKPEYSWDVHFTATDVAGIQKAIEHLASVLNQTTVAKHEASEHLASMLNQTTVTKTE